MSSNSLESGAEFSTCKRYRYALWRRWNGDGEHGQVMFVGLNPSTADEVSNDATTRRCIQFAKSWGYDEVMIVNVFGLCSLKPAGLKQGIDPVGVSNDQAMRDRLDKAALIVAAWGNHCPIERERQVYKLVNRTIYCLGKTKSGRPRHPLYLPKNTELELA